jgi:hypothetical protein
MTKAVGVLIRRLLSREIRVRNPMDTLTPELKRAVEQAGDSPVRLTDPETQRTYFLISAEVYERLLRDEDERREQDAFLRTAKKNAKARLREDA